MSALDRRLHPFRNDLAAEYLRDKIVAKHYVIGRQFQVNSCRAALRRSPDQTASLDTEILFGETVTLYEEKNNWAWIQSETDGYVGYMERSALSPEPLESTHSVAVLSSHIYTQPDPKTATIQSLPMTARVSVNDEINNYCRLANGGWVFSAHLAPIDIHATDHCEIAQKFLDTPYLWGGKTNAGIDCSGLVQVALARCGKTIPRDSDLQTSAGQTVVYSGDESVLRRGDLIFWPGHVGIWISSQTFIHANATEMRVSTGPLDVISAQIEASTGSKIIAVRRV